MASTQLTDTAAPRSVGRLFRTVPAPVRSGLLLFVTGAGFLVSPEPVWALLFYLLIVPTHGVALVRGIADGSLVRDMPPVLALAAGLTFWFVLTLAWDRNAAGHPGEQLLWVWNGLCTLIFVWGCHEAFAGSKAARDRLITVLIVCSVLNAAISILRLPFLANVLDSPLLRMPGWGETRHPILGAIIIGVGVLLAVSRLLEGRSVRANGFAAVVGLAFIFLTGSRGPMLAITGALALLLAMVRVRLLGIAVLAVLVAFGLVELLEPSIISVAWQSVSSRGGSDRLIIWITSLKAIAASPWVGLGPTAHLDRPNEGFPHNLFLSTVFYAGLVGLVLLLALFAMAGRIAWRQPRGVDRSMRLALLVYVVLSGMTDLSIVIKGPSPMWYIVWLPLILAMGVDRSGRRESVAA